MPNSTARKAELRIPELEQQFRTLTLLLYDTNVPLEVLRERVCPYLADDVAFVDPIISAQGLQKFKVGMRGFHCAFLFDFDIYQLSVNLNKEGSVGRVLIDGVMNLRTLRFYSYPLRTILVFDFVASAGDTSFKITRLEEMWSVGDMLRNAPILGSAYQAGRFLSGYFFTAAFFLSCAVATRLPWARHFSGGD